MNGPPPRIRLGTVAAACVLGAWIAPDRTMASDLFSVRADAGVTPAADTSWDLAFGGDFDTWIDGFGLRVGASTGALFFPADESTDVRWLLVPDLAVHFHPDAPKVRFFVTAQPVFALIGEGFYQGFRVGPELEWRQVPDGLRARFGLLYHPMRDASGELQWGGVSVRLTLEHGWSTETPLRVDPEEETCPDGLPPLPGTGCEPGT